MHQKIRKQTRPNGFVDWLIREHWRCCRNTLLTALFESDVGKHSSNWNYIHMQYWRYHRLNTSMHKLNRGHVELGILNNAVKEWFSKVLDGIGLSDDLVRVCMLCVCQHVCVCGFTSEVCRCCFCNWVSGLQQPRWEASVGVTGSRAGPPQKAQQLQPALHSDTDKRVIRVISIDKTVRLIWHKKKKGHCDM